MSDQVTAGREGGGFFALVQESPNLAVVVDEQGVLTFANAAALTMFGVSIDEAIGESGLRFIYPDDVGRLTARFSDLVHQPGISHSDSLRFVSAAGEVRVLETVATNLLRDEAISGIVIHGHDVTDRDRYLTRLESTLDAVTIAIANLVELRDAYTAGHQRQVAHIAGAIAREMRLSGEDVKGIEVAATLHDIGKVALPTEILTRPSRLSIPEFEIVKTHSQAGHDILADVPFPWPVADMILQHHERLDGSGYPSGLEGEDILEGSRIVAVADVVSAMSSDRPYRPAIGIAAALDELRSNRGRLYDEPTVAACLRLYTMHVLP